MTGSNRRRRLTRAGVLGTLAAFAILAGFGAHGSPAQASVPPPPTSPIKHVVVIYQENHTFDETLGALCIQDNRCDGSLTATLLDGTTRALTRSPDVVPTVNHDTKSQINAINKGLMNGWQNVKGCAAPTYNCLTYYDPTQIPNLAALARTYAISDRTFFMDRVPSFGAHIELVASDMDGFTGVAPKAQSGFPLHSGWGCDSNGFAPWIDPNNTNPKTKATLVPACIPDYTDTLNRLTTDRSAANGGAITTTPVSHVSTIMDSLDAAGLTWKLYTSATTVKKVRAYTWSICPVFAKCLYTDQALNLLAPSQIVPDALAGNLPSYSVLLPEGATGATSQHNGTSMLAGDNWVGQAVSAIMNGPDWSSTAIFITYDDCGCFYDHVPPPANLGVRAPMVIVSPYARPGFTDSDVASTASMLAFTEHTFGLAPLGTTDATAYDYSDSFDFDQAPQPGIKLTQTPVPSSSIRYMQTHPVDGTDPT